MTRDANGFAVVNLGLVAVWIALAVALVRRNRRLTGEAEDPARAGTAA